MDKIIWATHEDLCDSDHFPIVMGRKKDPPKTQQESFKRWIIEKADWITFTENINITFNQNSSLQDNINLLTKSIIEAANKSIPKTPGITFSNAVPWWNEEIKTAIENWKKALRKYKKTRSLEDLINFKKLKANTRQIIKNSKEKSWQKFLQSLQQDMPISTFWKCVSSLKGKNSRQSIKGLVQDNKFFTDLHEITNIIGSYFASVSATENYEKDFITYKKSIESVPILFDSSNTESYNQPISRYELISTIKQNLKKSALGPDGIHPYMIKNLPENAITFILQLYNKILLSDSFPDSWKIAHVIPILKPDKDPLIVSSYHPIALTSVLGKLYEKILNKRLIWYLESTNSLNKLQFGFRKNHSTHHALLDLQTRIHKAIVNKNHLYTIFFDLEKAYDLTWHYNILRSLYSAGIRGHLANFIKSFLTERTIHVRIGKNISDPFIIENGVPQGSVISVSLFLLAVNNISSFIPYPVT